MRRLLALTVLAAATSVLTPAAHATVECYGVDAGATHAGVCAGSWCPDVCFIVVDPYCYHDARVAWDWCGSIDDIG